MDTGPVVARFPARMDRLGEVMAFAQTRADALDADEAARFRLALLVEEAVTNVCRHAYANSEDGEVELAIAPRTDPPGLELLVRDWGPPFDPLSQPPPDTTLPLDQRPLGGLGILMLRETASRIEYRRVGETNELRMELLF